MAIPGFTCCPEGYTYDSKNDNCIGLNYQTTAPIACDVCCPDGTYYNGLGCCPINKACSYRESLNSPTIPCLPCVCDEPVEPTPCEDCTNNTLPISFILNTNTKNCVDCNPPEGTRILSNKSSAFMPYFIIDPTINFKLK